MTPNLVSLTDPTSPAAEAYRRLRVNLASPTQGPALQTLLVVAAGPEADKAGVVANLGVAFARVGKQTVVVDCDLRQPGQHALFGLANDAGLADALRGGGARLQESGVAGLRVLTSGPAVEAPSDLLASQAMKTLLGHLRDDADVVLLDAPPVVSATDAAELAGLVDGVLLVVAAGHTRREHAKRALELLNRVGAHVVGATLVNVPADGRSAWPATA